MTDKVRFGGLMRCCLESLDQSYEEDPARKAREGDVLPCQWCSSRMIFLDGAWARARALDGEEGRG